MLDARKASKQAEHWLASDSQMPASTQQTCSQLNESAMQMYELQHTHM
jgi:hypothetical protein